MGWGKNTSSLKSVAYPAVMKLSTVIPYLKKIEKNHVTNPLSSANISVFSPEISKFRYIKKYRYSLHSDT